MTHPLTHDMVQSIWDKVANETSGGFTQDDLMRAAADWQLEQVKKIVEHKIEDMYRRGYDSGGRDLVYRADVIEEFFEDIMQEMRPQEDN